MHQMLLLSPFLPFVIQGDTFDFILHLEFRKFHEPVPHIGLENGSEGKAILLPIVIEDGCSFPAEQPNMGKQIPILKSHRLMCQLATTLQFCCSAVIFICW